MPGQHACQAVYAMAKERGPLPRGYKLSPRESKEQKGRGAYLGREEEQKEKESIKSMLGVSSKGV